MNAIITAIIAVIGTLATAIFGLVCWFVGRKQADKGLMKERPSADRWPASMVFADDTPLAVIDSFQEAGVWWNRRLKKRAFVDVGDLGPGLVVSIETAEDGDFDMRFVFENEGEFARVLVNHRVILIHGTNLLRRSAHELGHALGLGHDEDRFSVMYPRAVDGHFDVTQRDLGLVNRVMEAS